MPNEQDRFKNMVEDSQDWFWEFDENANFTYVSPKVKELLGYEPEEILGRNAFDLMDEDEAERVRKYFDPIARKFLAFNSLINTNRHKDGHEVVIESSGTPVFDEAGVFRGYRGIDRDITERRDDKIELLKREKLFRDFFESNPSPTTVTSLTGTVLMVNPAFLAVSGLKTEEVIGKTTLELGFWSTPEERKRALAKIQKEGSIDDFEVTYTTADNNKREWLLSSRLVDHDGEQQILSTIIDVTARKKSEETLRKLDEAKSDFIRIAAHELNTPLSAIIGYAEILKDSDLVSADKSLDNHVSIIANNAEILSKLIRDLLDVEKIQLGYGLSILLEKVSLNELLKNSVSSVSPQCRNHRIILNRKNEPPEHIMVDEHRMTQVLTNVLSNALKYSPNDGDIEVVTETEGEHVKISIRDSGIGMTDEQVEHVFEKFYRGNPEDHRFAGLGLGMNIAKKIVAEHEGDITITSEPGKGTVVTITLPLKLGQTPHS